MRDISLNSTKSLKCHVRCRLVVRSRLHSKLLYLSDVDSLTFLSQGDMNKKSSKLDLNKISSHDVSFVGSTLNLAVEV